MPDPQQDGDEMSDRIRRIWLHLRTAVLLNPAIPIPAYLFVVGGLAIIGGEAVTPDSLRETLPLWLTWVWTSCLCVGGALATAGCLINRGRVESAGLTLAVFAVALYAATLFVVEPGTGLAASVALTAIVSTLLIRLRILALNRRGLLVARRFLDEGSP